MNYELAKRLKDAGFPQEIKHGGQFYYDNMPNYFISANLRKSALEGETTLRPTLSELIEACGEGLQSIIRRDSGEGDNWETRSTYERFNATYLDEALSNLWLALNKK